MKKVYNVNYMLEVLKSGKKVYPKKEMYEACKMLVMARHYGILDHWKLMLKNCENESLFCNEQYLNNTLMQEK